MRSDKKSAAQTEGLRGALRYKNLLFYHGKIYQTYSLSYHYVFADCRVATHLKEWARRDGSMHLHAAEGKFEPVTQCRYSMAFRLSFISMRTILRRSNRVTSHVKSAMTTGAIIHMNQLIPPRVPTPIILNTSSINSAASG